MRRIIALACALGTALAVGLAPVVAEGGGKPCVGYSATAPVVGTSQNTVCSPVAQPSPFDNRNYVQNCQWAPPAGVSECISVTVYRP